MGKIFKSRVLTLILILSLQESYYRVQYYILELNRFENYKNLAAFGHFFPIFNCFGSVFSH